MHPSVLEFVTAALAPDDVFGQVVIESGAYDVNGSVRPVIEAHRPLRYIGTDLREGPRVDLQCTAEDLPMLFGDKYAGVVVAAEMLEHAKHWQLAMVGLIRVLASGGVLVVTTRSEGAGYHCAPDYWRFSVEAMRQILTGAALDVERCEPDPENPGVLAKARKPGCWAWPMRAPLAWDTAGVTAMSYSGPVDYMPAEGD